MSLSIETQATHQAFLNGHHLLTEKSNGRIELYSPPEGEHMDCSKETIKEYAEAILQYLGEKHE